MSNTKECEAFEAWATRMDLHLDRVTRRSRTYADFETYIAWRAWQAASSLHAQKVEQLREALELARIGIACTVERMRAEEHPDLDAMTLGLQHIDAALNATKPEAA